MSNQTLVSYNQELQPKIRKLLELKDALNEWKKEDQHVQEVLGEIKELQDNLKQHIEDKESELLREIKDIEIERLNRKAIKDQEHLVDNSRSLEEKLAEKVDEIRNLKDVKQDADNRT